MELSSLRLRNKMFNKKDELEEEISEVAFEDLEPTELSPAYHKPSNVRIIMDSCAAFAIWSILKGFIQHR